MKIDRSKLKKSASEVPAECRQLIQTLRSCKDDDELLQELRKIESWTFGKCELFHWADILDICDVVLERATTRPKPNSWLIACDDSPNSQLKELLLCVIHFTTLLIEHSFSRHLYNSMEHLITLLSSSDMNVTLAVLNLLYMFSKRSNFIPRLNAEKRYGIIRRLTHLAESWGGKENGYGLADCCKDLPTSHFPAGATSLHFEYFNNPLTENEAKFQKYMKSSCSSNTIVTIHLDEVEKIDKPLGTIMEELVTAHSVPLDKQVLLFTHLRLAHCFGSLEGRLKCVQVRLQALSVLIYSNALMENAHQLLYSNLLEEMVEVLEMQDLALVEIKAAALRTLTAIIHLDRNPHMSNYSRNCRLNTIIDVTGASSYHGFLPSLVRSCIAALTAVPQSEIQKQQASSAALEPATFPLPLATALFSFLYHLASYEPGGEALVSCNMMESLLKVIKWPGSEIEHITFVTRAVRVIDLMTNTDMQSFEVHGGLNTFINRLESEVTICRAEQPFVIIPENSNPNQEGMMDISRESSMENSPRSPDLNEEANQPRPVDPSLCKGAMLHCLPQRAALLKSMLNFLKKAIQDPTFTDSIRHVMDGSLPSTLKHIISNAEYYGPSLFLLATDVVTVYVFQEPSLLTSLQDNGLTDVMLHALLVRKVPATREVLGSLPNVFSALCLNTRGLAAFVKCCPFEQMFKVLLSPKYLAAMRRRRSSDPMGDTASNLGNAMDELMRHQPSLKHDATAAIIKLLQELCNLGQDPKYVCWRSQKKLEVPTAMLRSGNRGGSSDDEEEEDDDENTQSRGEEEQPIEEGQERIAVPLVDYIVNVMKFVDAILSNNSTDDHVREFKEQGGLKPLISLLGLPNLPVDCTLQLSSQAVSSVCKSIMNLSHESEVLSEGFRQVDPILRKLYRVLDSLPPNEIKTSTVLLKEMANVPDFKEAFSYPDQTPAVHAFSALNDFMVMFTHVCRTGQSDIRGLNISMWGSHEGNKILDKLIVVYDHVVWESTALLVLRGNENFDITGHFGKEDLPKLTNSPDDVMNPKSKSSSKTLISDIDTNSSDKDSYPEVFRKETRMQTLGKSFGLTDAQLSNLSKLVEPTIRLRQSMSDFFSFLVKLCVGTPLRQRRGQIAGASPFVATPQSCAVATRLGAVIKNAVWYKKFLQAPYDYLTVKYLISSITFVTPMMLDEKRVPYHLMLNEFIANGGYLRFFETFRWVLCADKGMIDIIKERYDVPEDFHPPNIPWLPICSEFVESWLELLEKLANPKSVLESPHNLSVKANGQLAHPFEPTEYISHMQKLAFESLMLLWNLDPRNQILTSANVIPLMLQIWKHILKSEEVLDELKKDKAKDVPAPATTAAAAAATTAPTTTTTTAAAAAAAAVAATPPTGAAPAPAASVDPELEEVGVDNLNRLIDMGFSRAMSIRALRISSTVEQATEYLLSAPSIGMDIDVSEEDQMHQAIAMSLGESTDKIPGPKAKEKVSRVEKAPEPLSKDEIYNFTMAAPEVCLKLLDTINSSATMKACDLLVIIAKRNGEEFRKHMLNTILKETSECIKSFLEQVKDVTDSKKYLIIQSDSRESGRTADLLKFFSMLFEEMKIASCLAMEETGIIEQLIALMSPCLPHITFESTPKWLGPIFQLLDQYERVAVSLERQETMHKICGKQWKWYDVSTSKWCAYNAPYNKIINDAYWSGETCVRISYGRRKYTLQFSCMYQCNDDTGNRRPIMLCLNDANKEEAAESKPETEEIEDSTPKKMEVDSSPPKPCESDDSKVEKSKAEDKKIRGIGDTYSKVLIKACIKLLSVPVCPDALQAMMKVLVRITRNYKCAQIFFEHGGVWKLLMLKNLHHFLGAINLITIVIRHTIEEPKVLKLAMEKVLRAKTQASIPHYYKELFYLLRICGNAICRAPDSFMQLCKESLRADVNIITRRDDDDMPLICTTGPLKHYKAITEGHHASASVVNELLDALLQQMAQAESNKGTKEKSKEKEEPPPITTKTSKRTFTAPPPPPSSVRHSLRNRNLTAVVPSRSQNDVRAFLGEFHLQDAEEKTITVRKRPTSEETAKPLVPCSALLKILAELVRSYNHVGKIITEYQHPKDGSAVKPEAAAAAAAAPAAPATSPGGAAPVQQTFSAVHYIIEHLFDTCPDLECHNMVRMLISALASCSFSTDIQTHVVMEVKAALHRALSMPESNSKHTEVQEICNLISVMIDSCPSPVPPCPYAILGSIDKPPCTVTANSIVRIMIRKGILVDLARIPYSLDLSSPNLQGTVNGLIKPLETLTRIVIHPPGTVKDGKKTKPGGQDAGSQTSRNSASGTSRRTQSTSESMGLEELMEHLMESARDGSVVQDIMEFSVSDERPRHNMNRAHSDDVHLFDDIHALNVPESPSSRQWEESDSNYDDDDDNHEDEQRDEGNNTEQGQDSPAGSADGSVEGGSPEPQDSSGNAPNLAAAAAAVVAAAAAAASALDTHGGNHEDDDEDDEMDEDDEEEDEDIDDDDEEEEEDEESEEEAETTGNELPLFNIGINAHPTHHHHHGQQQQNPLVAFRGSLDSDNLGGGGGGGLQRQNASRSQRSSLQRRYLAHLHSRGPAILQRLLGPEPLGISESRHGHGPLPVIESLTLLDEEDGEEAEQGGYLFGSNLATTVNNIPNALHWWNEEGKLLDGDSMPACSIVLASKIIKQLETQKDKDLSEKKKKKQAEDELKLAKSAEASKEKMETETTPTETPAPQQAPQQPTSQSSQLQELQLIASEVSNIVDSVFRTAQTLTSGENDQTNSTTSEMPPSDSAPADQEHTQTENTVSSLTPTDSCEVGQRDELSATSPMTPVPASQNTDNDFSENMHTSPPADMSTDPDKSETKDEASPSLEEASAVSPMEQQESEKALEPVTPPTEASGADGAASSSTVETMQASNYEPLDFDTINSWFGGGSRSTPNQPSGESVAPSIAEQFVAGVEAVAAASAEATAAAAAAAAVAAATSTNDAELPEGVDPSFLAALPEEMRQEVISEQLRLQRLRRARTAPQETEMETPLEVNPEFLAALPPNIQEEVLTQQRLEEQRRAAAAANPNDPVDAAAFFQNLPSSLRQAILTDMEESQISVLPPDLAAEAQTLRRDWEARNRQIMQERFLTHVQSNNTLSSILRNSGIIEGRVPSRYISSIPTPTWGRWNRSTPGNTDNLRTACSYLTKWKGKQVLDQEAITCLLVLLFVEDPKLNITRLQRVLRHLCWHAETRDWVIGSLISILEMCNDCYEASLGDPTLFSKPRQSIGGKSPAWLNITMDAALGSRTNVFNIQRPSLGKRSANGERSPNCSISIHPQAASSVANRVLETLIFIGEAFPEYFLPHRFKDHTAPKSETSAASAEASSKPDFWETLIKLDTVSALKNSKSLHKWQHNPETDSVIPFTDTCHFRRFIPLLSFPLIQRSPQLIDSTICLLYQVSTGLVNECAVRVNIVPEDTPIAAESEESRAASPTRQFAQFSTRLRASKVPPKYSVNTKGTSKGTYPYIPTYIREVDVPERHLKLLIDVLIGRACLENGLKNAKIFLNNLCRGPEDTKDMVIKLVMDGVKQIGRTVEQDISVLLSELRQHCVSPTKKEKTEGEDADLRTDRILKGKLADRFTNSTVIVNAPSKVTAATSHDLQLPSIAQLTSKMSSQSSFLRLLKVLIELRNKYNKKGTKHLQSHPGYVFVPVTTDVVCSSSEEDTEDYEPPADRESGATNPVTASSTTQSKDYDFNKPEYGKPREDSLPLSQELDLSSLWDVLSQCLSELENNQDQHAVLILQPAVEAFFYVHSSLEDSKNAAAATESAENQAAQQEATPTSTQEAAAPAEATGAETEEAAETAASTDTSETPAAGDSSDTKSASEAPNLSPDMRKFLSFAEMHRTVLNQILRQTNTHLADGPFSVLAHHTRILDFDVKRRYFRTELDRLDEGIRREELAVHVRRSHVFEDSFRELHRRSSEEWKNRFYIVFEGEEGQDAGGLLREWYVIISREIFNPMYALFCTSPGDRVTYMINSTSHCNPNHLSYFKFVGRVIAKAVYDNKLLECYFTRSFYKHILSKQVKHTDMESEDYSFYKGLEYLMEHNVSDLGYELTFSTEVQEFGVTEVRDLIPNGRNVNVTEANKMDYITLVCQMKMTGAIQKQLNAFLEGFYDIIPKKLISIFNEQEMELLISGLPNVDIEDLKANTEYHKYQSTSLQIQWFWRALRSFDQADRAKFLQFVTGTSKVPLQGFGALEGMNGVQKFQIHRDDRSTDRLPSAHTCFNQLDLPVYETYDKLKSYLLKAIHECSEGFGFA